MRGHHGDGLLDEHDDLRLRRGGQRYPFQVQHRRTTIGVVGVDHRPKVLHLKKKKKRQVLYVQYVVCSGYLLRQRGSLAAGAL